MPTNAIFIHYTQWSFRLLGICVFIENTFLIEILNDIFFTWSKCTSIQTVIVRYLSHSTLASADQLKRSSVLFEQTWTVMGQSDISNWRLHEICKNTSEMGQTLIRGSSKADGSCLKLIFRNFFGYNECIFPVPGLFF